MTIDSGDGFLNELEFDTRIREFCREFEIESDDDRTIGAAIDLILAIINREIQVQVNQILHHHKFQRLEATYRSIQWLTEVTNFTERVRIGILDVSGAEISQDVSAGYKKSVMFDKIFKQRFDRPFGKAVAGDLKAVGYPYGMIIGDFEYSHDTQRLAKSGQPATHKIDLNVLVQMSQIGRECFCPFVCGVSADVFDIDSFVDLEMIQNVAQVFESRYSWREFRKSSSSKFVGLVMPRVLIRKPYQGTNRYFVPDPLKRDRLIDKSFFFNEEINGDNENLLWGNGAFMMAEIAGRAFYKYGWFADIRGYEHDAYDECGIVTRFPLAESNTDSPGVAPLFPTEIAISSSDDSLLSELGFISLYSHKYTGYCGILSCQTAMVAREKDVEFNLSTMLNYVLCICRLGLELKYELTRLVGTNMDQYEIERRLEEIIRLDVTSSTDPDERRKKPLAKANVNVVDDPDRPGSYQCDFQFEPHFQFHNVDADMALTTVLRKKD